jgi:cyclic pyranopterin phosphate synthase
LKAAGLSRVTVSLDSLRPERFRDITGGGRLEDVLRGIDAALDAGLTPLKINVVALRGRNDDEIGAFAELARRLDVEVRFIEYMPLGGNDWKEAFLPAGEIEAGIRDAVGAFLDPLPSEGAASRRFAPDAWASSPPSPRPSAPPATGSASPRPGSCAAASSPVARWT